MNDKPVILTGLRANNDLHIGNYFGALLPLIDQIENNKGIYQVNLFIPDLHSITTKIEYSILQKNIMNSLRIFVASGLSLNDPYVYLYRQSYIPAHSELATILNSFTYFGELARMTQFKTKSHDASKQLLEKIKNKSKLTEIDNNENEDRIEEIFNKSLKKYKKKNMDTYKDILDILISVRKEQIRNKEEHIETLRELNEYLREAVTSSRSTVGLFSYPVLMASDILLYGAKYVPVGDDQTQHLEFTRDIAERMNKRFGELFVVPEPVKKQHEFFGKDQGLRIKDLADPAKKMSKSEESDKGVIFLNDDPETARKKIMSATTDDLSQVKYDPDKQPGVSNLLQIYALLSEKDVKEAEKEFINTTKYSDFKQAVADKVVEFLHDFQDKLSRVDQKAIDSKLVSSESAMNKTAAETLNKVQKAVGLR